MSGKERSAAAAPKPLFTLPRAAVEQALAEHARQVEPAMRELDRSQVRSLAKAWFIPVTNGK